MSKGRILIFQAEETLSAKVQRWKHARFVEEQKGS